MNDTNSKEVILTPEGRQVPLSDMTVHTEQEEIVKPNMTKDDILEAFETSRKQKEADEIKANQNTTTIKLPSNGLINPKIKEVTLRRMTTKQAKALFTSNDPNYLTTLLLSCIVEPVNITANDLHSNDIIYLLFILRYISSPRTLVQRTICSRPTCQEEYDAEIRVNELKVNYATPEKYVLNCKLPDSGDVIAFKILSEGELINCENISNRKIKQDKVPLSDEGWVRMTSKIAYMIKTVNDQEFNTFDEKLEYLENLTYYDFETFNKAYNEIISSFGLERSIVSTCPKCGETNEVFVYISPEFFRLV